MYKKRYRQKTFQNCRLFKPLTIVTDLYTYMWSSEGQNMGMTSYPIIATRHEWFYFDVFSLILKFFLCLYSCLSVCLFVSLFMFVCRFVCLYLCHHKWTLGVNKGISNWINMTKSAKWGARTLSQIIQRLSQYKLG